MAPPPKILSATLLSEALEFAAPPGNKEAAVIDGQRVTFPELQNRITSFAATLQACGVTAGDRVAVLAPNSIRYIVAFFGVTRLGAVVMPLHPRLGATELADVIAQSPPRVLLADERAIQNDDGVRRCLEGSVGLSEGRLLRLRDGSPATWRGTPLDDGAPSELPRHPVASSAPAVLFHTSGTTGRPKPVLHSAKKILASIAALHRLHQEFYSAPLREQVSQVASLLRTRPARLLHAVGRQTWMTPVQFSGISGHEVMLGSLLGGHKLVSSAEFHPRTSLSTIQTERVNIFAGTSAMLELMMRVGDFESYDLSSLIMIGLGGGPTAPEVAKRIRARFRCDVGIGYGSTEMAGGVTVTRLQDSEQVQTETVGRPFPGVRVEVVDESGREVPHGQIGEIICHLQPEEGTVLPDAGGTPERMSQPVRTGDLGRLDDSGNVIIVGRKDDMINRAGWNIRPAEVEHVIGSFPDVAMCAVLGVPEPGSKTRMWAFVVPARGTTISRTKLIAHLRAQLSPHKVPDRIRITTNLPLTPEGKVRKYRLLERARSELRQ